jgi:DNA-binding transcriptional MerR regulator
MPNSTPPILVDLKEAAKMSDRSTRTIRNWIKEGKLKASKKDPNNMKSKLLINKEELQILLATEIDMNPPRKPIEKTSETLEKEVKELHIELERERFKVAQKDEIIEILKNMQPDVASIKNEYETKLKEVQEKLQIAEKELAIYKDRYQREVSKGILERLFSPPKEVKLLPGPTPE